MQINVFLSNWFGAAKPQNTYLMLKICMFGGKLSCLKYVLSKFAVHNLIKNPLKPWYLLDAC